MKKILIFAFAAFAAVTMNAQIVSSTSRSITVQKVEEAPSDKLKFFHFGVGTNTFTGKDWDEVDNNSGFQFGYEFQKPMGSHGFFRGMDFSIATRGWKFSEGGYEESLRAWNVMWSPFFFGYKFEPVDWLQIRPQFGLFISADFAGNFKAEGGGYSEETSIWDYGYDEYYDDYEDEYLPVDAGIIWGVDVVFLKRFVAGVNFQKGFAPYDTDIDGGAFNFMFRVGIAVGK